MRIAILVNFFPPKRLAGTEIASYKIAKYLAEKGHEVHVVTSFDQGLQKNEIKDDFYIHRIINFRKPQYIGSIFFLFLNFLEIKKINPDIIHIQSIPMGIPGLLSKIFLRKPYVVWGRGSDVYRPDLFAKLISKIILKNADAVIALTQTMKKSMENIYRRPICVIPNGIDIKKFRNVSKDLNNTSEKKIILFVGTLRSVKGVEYLIEAMKTIKVNYDNIKLLIIGEGEDRDKLKDLVNKLGLDDCVEFAGQISNHEIPKYMKKSDIFVLPSLSEGFPNVILEAMAAGLPIVSTNVGGVPDIIQEEVNGLLVKPMSPRDTANGVLMLLKDDELRKKMSANNKIEAQKYSLDKVVDNLENIYVKAINNSKFNIQEKDQA